MLCCIQSHYMLQRSCSYTSPFKSGMHGGSPPPPPPPLSPTPPPHDFQPSRPLSACVHVCSGWHSQGVTARTRAHVGGGQEALAVVLQLQPSRVVLKLAAID